jgi:hypothetical protein
VLLAANFGISWLLARRYRAIAAVILLALSLVAVFFIPTRHPARRRSDEITLLVVLAVLAPAVAIGSVRRSRVGPMAAEWAKAHGFTVTSKSRAPAQETLPETLRQLPLLRRGWEQETRYLLERNDAGHDLQMIIFGLVTSRISTSRLGVVVPPGPLLFMTVFAFRRHTLRLPAFVLRPASATATIAERPRDDGVSTQVELFGKPRFAEWYTLHAQHTAELERVFSDEVVNELEREPGWCLEGLGEWCIAYRYHQAKGFWTLRPSQFEDCAQPDQLSVRLEVAHHLFRQMTARLS